MQDHPQSPGFAPAPFGLELRECGTVVTVAVHGEVDMATAPDVRQAVVDGLQRRPELVLLDLSGVGFVDSSGVRAVVGAHELAQRAGRLLLVVPSPPVRKTLEFLGQRERLRLVGDPSQDAHSTDTTGESEMALG